MDKKILDRQFEPPLVKPILRRRRERGVSSADEGGTQTWTQRVDMGCYRLVSIRAITSPTAAETLTLW